MLYNLGVDSFHFKCTRNILNMEGIFLLKSISVAKNCACVCVLPVSLVLHTEMWRTANSYNDDAVKPLVFAWKSFQIIPTAKVYTVSGINTSSSSVLMLHIDILTREWLFFVHHKYKGLHSPKIAVYTKIKDMGSQLSSL